MTRVAEILGCLDPELNPLADLVGDFDARSPGDSHTWRVAQWRQIAFALGWPSAFEYALASARRSPAGLASLTDAAVEAFTQWLANQQGHTPELERARVRHQSLVALDAIGSETHSLFRVSAMSTRLPDSACYAPSRAIGKVPVIVTPAPDPAPGKLPVIVTPAPDQPPGKQPVIVTPAPGKQPSIAEFHPGNPPKPPDGPDTLVKPPPPPHDPGKSPLESILGVPLAGKGHTRARAFATETAASYFGPATPAKPRGCIYPIRLSLGTYPWVYGNMLDREAPGLRWEAGRPWRPAALAMRVMASLWADPVVNLGQDARLVTLQYRNFRATTGELLEGVPVWTDDTVGVAGRLYRRRGFLYVHHGSTALARLVGPRGAVAASAYNHVKRCFAAFFCARRAYVRGLSALPVEARDAYARNPDPCARKLQKAAG